MDRIDKAIAVLKSEISGYLLWKETGISRAQISRYRNEELKIGNMTIANAIKLAEFYDTNMK